MRQEKEHMAEKREIEQIRKLYTADFGKFVTSVLADLNRENLAPSKSAIMP